MVLCGTRRRRGRLHRIACATELDSVGCHVINLPRVDERAVEITSVIPHEQPQCPLLRLPVELRDLIWRLVLGESIIPVCALLRNTDKKAPGYHLGGSWQWRPHSLKTVPLDDPHSLPPNRFYRLRSAQVALAGNLALSSPLAVLRTCRRM